MDATSHRGNATAASLGEGVAVATAYFLLAAVGFRFAQFAGNVSPVWPATGLAVAAGILLGWRALPPIYVAAFASHVWNGVPWWAALLIAVGNTAEAGVAAWAVRSAAARQSPPAASHDTFHVPRLVFRFAAGTLASCWAAALMGVAVLALLGDIPVGSRFYAALTWYLGDVTGAFVLAPVLVLAANAKPRWRTASFLEGAILLACLGFVAVLLFTGFPPPGWSVAGLSILCVPPLVWAAFRMGPTFTASALLALDAVAIGATFLGIGPFQAASTDAAMAVLQVFVGTLSLLLYPLAAIAAQGRSNNAELELRVAERTAKLEALNLALREEVAQRTVAERRADEAQRLALLGSWRWDLRTQQVEWSAQMHRLLGYDPAEAPPSLERFMARIHPDDRERVGREMQGARTNRDGVRSLFRVVRPDGTRILLVDSVVQSDEAGPVAMTGATRDVTEQSEREAAVRESLDRFRILADASPVGVFRTDAVGRVEYANARWSEIAGCDHRDMEAIKRAVHPDDQPALQDAWRAALASGKELIADFRYRHADGKVVQCHTRATPVRDGAGKVTGFVGTLEDVTQRREVEAKEREMQRLSEQAAFKTNFLRTAAHELGTPLTPLKIQVRVLKGLVDETRERERKAVDILERNVDRLALLVRDLLESARLQSGRMRLVVRDVDLSDTVHDVLEAFQDQAIQSGIVLDLRGPPHVAVEADPDRIAQVLFNLLSNAMKFTRKGGRVHVDVVEAPSMVRVAVQDDGAGFTPEQAQQLFQPFVQVHDEMRQPRGGSGLGLYISRGIVEQHGGSLSCHSEGPGKGATFTITLPRHVPTQVVTQGVSVTARV